MKIGVNITEYSFLSDFLKSYFMAKENVVIFDEVFDVCEVNTYDNYILKVGTVKSLNERGVTPS